MFPPHPRGSSHQRYRKFDMCRCGLSRPSLSTIGFRRSPSTSGWTTRADRREVGRWVSRVGPSSSERRLWPCRHGGHPGRRSGTGGRHPWCGWRHRRAGQLHRGVQGQRGQPEQRRDSGPGPGRQARRQGGPHLHRRPAWLRDHRLRQGRRRGSRPTRASRTSSRTTRSTSCGTQPNPPSWGLDRIDQRNLPLDNSYTYPNTASTCNVYIIDTGIRFSHNDFGGRAVSGYDAVDGGYGRRLQRPRHARRRHGRRLVVRGGQGRPDLRRCGC